MLDVLIIGCGFSGAAAARILAEKGKKVLILEKRNHIAGNMYDEIDPNGVLIHRYGPHIFHTKNDKVYQFLSRFSGFHPYEHKVLGRVSGLLIPIPFNFKSIDMLFDKNEAEKLKQKLKEAFPDAAKVSVLDLLNHHDEGIKKIGQFVYDNVFLHYTAKQWGMDPALVDKSTINRVPVRLGYDDRYFPDATIQQMPDDGFTKLFSAMLDHPNIKVELSCDALKRIKIQDNKLYFDNEPFLKPVIFTGAIDELFGHRFGPLPYRSLKLAFEQKDSENYQPAAVVNYPNEEDFTRITEFKHLTGQHCEKTTILKEYPQKYDGTNIPFYVVTSKENSALYNQYKELADAVKGLYLCGRLADFKYYDMDAAVARAMELAADI